MEDDWRTIPEFTDYEVSRFGDVRKTSTGKMIVQRFHTCGYKIAHLQKDGRFHDSVRVHRLVASAWIPNPDGKQCVDHINGVRHCNIASNLRWVTHNENMYNQRLSSANTSGVRGVWKSKHKWIAEIKIDRKKIYLGSYDSLEEATAARRGAAHFYFGEFCNEREETPL